MVNSSSYSEWGDSDGDGIPDHLESSQTDLHEELPVITAPIDSDGDGIPDEFDEDDDNDGVPDVFEYEHMGKHIYPWENEHEDVRSILCPRIKANLACGKHLH